MTIFKERLHLISGVYIQYTVCYSYSQFCSVLAMFQCVLVLSRQFSVYLIIHPINLFVHQLSH